jgi:hypothetical protein
MGFYRKNIGGAQQIVRLVIGVGGAIGALIWLAAPLAYLGVVAGLAFAITGLVGYCPACAVAGINTRK